MEPARLFGTRVRLLICSLIMLIGSDASGGGEVILKIKLQLETIGN